ncbi:MFS transporter AraJ [Alistipes sp.]|jgi:arabinose efflux permease|nr:MFS transporter AraJ [Alistipes sp.]MBS6099996.1 MFS transporter AraJ [Alistipes sp.]HJI20273.1 MFS transporter AraJ [Rikenellaceae bacterium]
MKKSLIALAFGTLALGMAEFVMMGILPDIARELGVTIPMAGHLISAYALGVCIGAPAVVLIARRRPLKQILLILVAMIIAGNVCAALSPGYWTLFAMRLVSGLPHGAFFGVGSIVAERVADRGHKTEAVSIMIVGMTVANLFGVPLGTYISNVLTWRLAFGMVGVWGAVALLLVAWWVPRIPALPDTGLRGQFRFLRHLAPWLVIGSTMVGNGGIFCWYSYVNPFMARVAGFPEHAMTLIIMLAGFGMLAGNLIGGRFSDRFTPERVVRFTQAFVCAALLSLFFLGHHGWIALVLMTLLTGSLFALSSPQQLLMLENSRGSEMLGAASAQVAFNLGNALGAYFGGLPMDHGLSYRYATLPGAGFALLGFLMLVVYCRKYPRRRDPAAQEVSAG